MYKRQRLRREGYVTGNVFGREMEGSLPVKIEKSAVEKLLKISNKGSQIMLDVEMCIRDRHRSRKKYSS